VLCVLENRMAAAGQISIASSLARYVPCPK